MLSYTLPRTSPLLKIHVSPEELALEMAAARKRREEKTAKQLMEARVYALRTGLRPGSSRTEVEERARSLYPRLSEELLDKAITSVCGPAPEAPKATPPTPTPTP